MQVQIDKKYIWFPVQMGAGREKVSIFLAGEDPVKLFEFDLPVVSERVDFYSALCVEDYLGETLSISVDFPVEGIGSLAFFDVEPIAEAGCRPMLHFAAQSGWINDPNGLFSRDGIFHMYFQYNPYDTKWGNMHWGHAVSTDLIRWKQEKTVLFPDENGTVFSGSALLDKENRTGHGWNTILFFYTAAGGTNEWSRSRKFIQKMAYSTDGGMTLCKDPDFQIGSIERENRDPKVFYHEKTHAFIMVLFLGGNDFGIFRSESLDKWEMTQRLTLKGGWECPDLFELPVEGTDQTCWIFRTADGFYFTGVFDGFRFNSTREFQRAFIGSVPYAAQTFSGVSGRVLSVSWLRISPEGKTFSGIMSVPCVLSLVRTENGLKMRNSLPLELISRRSGRARIRISEAGRHNAACIADQPYEIHVSFCTGTLGSACLYFGSHTLFINFEKNLIITEKQEILFERGCALDIDLLVDYDVIELRAQQDTLYYVYENKNQNLSGAIDLDMEFPGEADISVYDIK